MLNVAQITSRLAMMPDASLQKYAAMHKEDPYIMALAVSESNRRKQLRNAAQAPQGGEMPKVADQAVAEMAPQMLPEEQGIGQLPAGNMNFAGGGIIAFADGGDVERYDVGGPTMRPGEDWMSFRRRVFQEELAAEQAKRQQEYADSEAARQRALAERGGAPIPPSPYGIPRATLVPNGVTPSAPAPAASAPAAPAPAAPAPAAPPAPTVRAPGAGAPRVANAGPAAPAAPAAAAPNLDFDSLMAAALKRAGETTDPQAAAREALGKERVTAKETEVAGLKAITEKFNDIYKGRRERLDARESELGKTKDQHTGLALLQAGAAMMSTPGGFTRALGKGVAVGTEQYAAGMEKLQAAKDKLLDARDRLEEVEAQRGELSARELFKANNEITNVKLSAREDLIKAAMEWGKMTREEATKRVDMQLRVGLEQLKEQGLNTRNAADIAARLQAARISAGPRENIMSEYTKFLKENPQYLTNEQAGMAAFLRARGALGVSSETGGTSVTDSPTGNVRPG